MSPSSGDASIDIQKMLIIYPGAILHSIYMGYEKDNIGNLVGHYLISLLIFRFYFS